MSEEKIENWVNRGPKFRVWFMADPSKPSSAYDRLVHNEEGFTLTRTERLFNENKFGRRPENNPFANGTFTSAAEVKDPDASLKTKTPNTFSDDELVSLLGEHWRTLQEGLDEITNPVTLRRMITLGVDADLSAKAVERAQKRLNELEPESDQKSDGAFDEGDGDDDDEDTF